LFLLLCEKVFLFVCLDVMSLSHCRVLWCVATILTMLGPSRAFVTTTRMARPKTVRLFSTATTKDTPKVKEMPVNYSMDEIVSLCKRRGIIFPSSEIYNGYAGFYDYGPLGCELKKNVKDAWWKFFVTQREDVVGIDSSIIHNPDTWKSSGTFHHHMTLSM